MFEGAFTALVTPFRAGAVDFEKLDELVEAQVAGGVAGLVPCGTTGESPTLSHAEHKEVVARVIERARGRVKVIAGSGSNSTAEALDLTRHAKAAGADGALLITPYYNKPTQEGLYRHFGAIAEAVDIPLVLYNVPGRTGVNLLPETVVRLAAVERVVAVKEASGNLDQASEICCRTELDVLSGDDSLTLPILSVGGRGVISVLSNVLPAEVADLVKRFLAADAAGAQALHRRLFPVAKAMFLETNPIPVKTALGLLGRMEPEMRLPLCPMADAARQKLAQALAEFGLKLAG